MDGKASDDHAGNRWSETIKADGRDHKTKEGKMHLVPYIWHISESGELLLHLPSVFVAVFFLCFSAAPPSSCHRQSLN